MKREFVVERQGRTFVLYAGLLDAAHGQGLRAIRTTLLQVPADENGHVAIVHAAVETEKGTFSGLGDASPLNVARPMVTCLIRMAETRAKARALRDAVNVGVTALEELGDADDDEVLERPAPVAPVRPTPLRPAQPALTPRPAARAARPAPAPLAPAPSAGVDSSRPGGSPGEPAAATAAQVRAIYVIGREAHGLSEGEVDERCQQEYGCRPDGLTKRQASEFISALQTGSRAG